jgi:hypothetical protein
VNGTAPSGSVIGSGAVGADWRGAASFRDRALAGVRTGAAPDPRRLA